MTTLLNDVLAPLFVRPFPLRAGVEQEVGPWTAIEFMDKARSREDRMACRRAQFNRVRLIAARLLASIGADQVDVPRGPDRAPVWPSGFVGSISHTDTLFGVAVAPERILRSVGIDIEATLAGKTLAAVLDTCLNDRERAAIPATGFGAARFATLCFSAKEALFKCLYPLVRRMFDFRDVEIAVDLPAGTVLMRLLDSLSADFPAGTQLQGRYRFGEGHVYTSFELDAAGSLRCAC